MWFNISKWNDSFLLDLSTISDSKLDENFRIYDSRFRVYLLRATIQASLFVFYLLSNFISRLSKIDPLAFCRERIEAWNCSRFWKKKRRDKYCKYNIISMQPWRKNMEYGYFNWRESSLKHDEIYIEKFRPYFQLYCSYLIPLSFIPFLFIYFQWDNPYIYSLQIFLSTINRQKNILWKICSFFVF